MPTRRPLPAAAVFDWDGTIVDTMGMIYRANVAALGHYGITMDRTWFREHYTPDWRRAYLELGIPEPLWDEMATERTEAEDRRNLIRAVPAAGGAGCPSRFFGSSSSVWTTRSTAARLATYRNEVPWKP